MKGCGHKDSATAAQVCDHFLNSDEEYLDYARHFTGTGMTSNYLCMDCLAQIEESSDVALVAICAQCLNERVDDYGRPECVRGCPEVLIADQSFELVIDSLPLPVEIGMVVDAVPRYRLSSSEWLLLTACGAVYCLDTDRMSSNLAAQVNLQEAKNKNVKPRLHASSCGRFAAVVNDYGQYGCVLDIQSGQKTMDLDAGNYHRRTVPFPIAFSERNGEPLVIHCTDWNRLDFSNPATGELLSGRGPTSYTSHEQRPEHYLDYFYGRLHISPSAQWIADDGWIWAPVGSPLIWQLSDWLDTNVWESEDGPTQQFCCQRAYYWDCAMVWIDDSRLAVEGIGVDDEEMIHGVRIFDVSQEYDSSARRRYAREVKSFAGPKGEFFSDGSALYSADSDGLSRWDIETGVRTGFEAGFIPSCYGRETSEFSGIDGGKIVRARPAKD